MASFKKQIFLFQIILLLTLTGHAQPFPGNWIATGNDTITKANTWHCFRKDFNTSSIDKKAIARIAVDTKYWLWINDRLVVYEGGLKRGPNPNDTYYDEIDIAPYLKRGKNSVAFLVWYWGGKGFSHNSSNRCGLYFDCLKLGLKSDNSWKAIVHPSYGPSSAPVPNFRLSEPNIFFDAGKNIGNWTAMNYEFKFWPVAISVGTVPVGPWNNLVKRNIPIFKDYDLHDYTSIVKRGDTMICKLPYNGHFSPYLKVSGASGKKIFMSSDTYFMDGYSPTDSLYTLCSEYITKKGLQAYESFGWLSGHEIRYVIPKEVNVLELKYRETGYNAGLVGDFNCDDQLLNTLWHKAQRTLYVNMRDNYMDCPDRERAQWAGDAAMEMGQAFYALDTNSFALSRKLYLDLANWQTKDSIIYNPVPEKDWKIELPTHSLMPLSELWRFFRYTHDTTTVKMVYPALKKYLLKWKIATNGQVAYRQGGWDWGDWGENQDSILIQHGWYLKTLQTARKIAALIKQEDDLQLYDSRINGITQFLNSPDCWNGKEYRYKSYTGSTDDRSNALMVITGVADTTKWAALRKVFSTSYYASPWMEKFVLESLFIMNYPQLALDRMNERYKPMIVSSLSTLWELWQYTKGESHGTSYDHGWSGGPLILLSEYIAGISPTEKPNSYIVKPMLSDLTRLQTAFPSPMGLLKYSIIKKGDKNIATVQIPQNVTVMFGIPTGNNKQLTINHNGKPTLLDAQDHYAYIKLNEGIHTLISQIQ